MKEITVAGGGGVLQVIQVEDNDPRATVAPDQPAKEDK
jgi:hypothetical protein